MAPVDTFDTLGAPWTATGTPAPRIVSGRLYNPVNGTYPGIHSGATRYSVVGAAHFAELVRAPNLGNSTTQAFFTLLSDPVDATKTGLEFTVTAGVLLARRWNAGTATQLASVTYNRVTHRWLRIREAGGTVFWETGPDGSTWPTPVYSTSSASITGVNLASLRFGLGAGYYGTEPDPGIVLWDNVNVAPADAPGSVDVGVWAPDPYVPTTWAAELNGFESATGHVPSIIYTYSGWGTNSPAFPTSQGNTIRSRGAQWCLTWEPWDASGAVTQPTYTLASIINGNHDAYITTFAQAVKAWGYPLWLRWAHEMNGNWYPWAEGVNSNSPPGSGQYAAAWRHIHDIFAAQSVTNVVWVWSPNITFFTDPMAGLYPGDDYVDVVGLDGYNWGTARTGKSWTTFEQTFGDGIAEILAVAPGKPLHLCEIASTETGGDKAAWITDMWARLKCRPEIRGFWWFHHNKETDWRVTSSEAARVAYAAGVSNARYAAGQVAPPGRVTTRARITGAQNTDAATWPVTLPASITAGELLLCFLAHDNALTTITGLTNGWQQLARQQQGTSTNHTGYVLWKRATGTDALTVTLSAAEQGTYVSVAVTGAHATINPIVATPGSYGIGVSPQVETMPALAGLAAGDYLAVLSIHTDATDTTTQVFTAPGGYSNPTTVNPATTAGAATFVCDRAYTAVAAITPGTASWATAEQGVAHLVAVPAAPATITPRLGSDSATLTQSAALAVTLLATPLVGIDTARLAESAAVQVTPRPPAALPAVPSSAQDAQGDVPTVTLSAPVGLTAGDYLICPQASDADGALGAMTAPPGWDLLGSRAGQLSPRQPFVKLWGKVATDADVAAGSFAFPDSTASECAAGLLRIPYGAYDPAGPVQAVTWGGSSTPQPTHSAPSLEGVPGGLLVTVYAVDTAGTPYTYAPPDGMGEHVAAVSGWVTLGVFSEQVAAAGPTGARAATLLTSTGPSRFGAARFGSTPFGS